MTAGVILRVNGENKIAVDPEGYSYARYIGILPTEEVIYVKPSSDVWFTKQEQEYIKQAERGESWSTIDFGARRSQNEHFWNKLRELGTVKLDSCMWSFKGAAA